MQRVEISITPKETALIYEGDEAIAASWAINGETVELYDEGGNAFATGRLGVLGAQYLPQLDYVTVSAINTICERFSLILPRKPL